MSFLGLFKKKKAKVLESLEKPALPEDRSRWTEEKKRRMKEKSLRRPLNDIVLDVQKGTIDIKDVFRYIDEKVKEKKNG